MTYDSLRDMSRVSPRLSQGCAVQSTQQGSALPPAAGQRPVGFCARGLEPKRRTKGRENRKSS